MATSEVAARRCAVYIDGYNLYYGRLRETPFKWLDVVQLSEKLLLHRDQNESLECVKFFTAPALATFATHGSASVEAQSAYHRALQTIHGARFELIHGSHTFNKEGVLAPEFVPGQAFDRTRRVRIWKLEEKKTDVNLAVRMYRDACQERYDRMILISNDSDAEPVLEAIKADFPSIMLGVVLPIRRSNDGSAAPRRPSGSLLKFADCNSLISDEQLTAAQLPDVVPTKKKPIRKPIHW